jgi:hypothetical protein
MVYLVDTHSRRIRRIKSPLPAFGMSDIMIASQDGQKLYQFDQTGRHLRTLDARTQDTIKSFEYTADGLLEHVIDRNNQVTTLQYSTDRITVTAPYNQQTILGLDADGYMDSYTNPAGETTEFSYSPNGTGLLTKMTEPQRPDGTSATHTFSYDEFGFLTRDENGVGGVKTLARPHFDANGYTVLVTNALSDTTQYEFEKRPNGERHLVVTAPNGALRRRFDPMAAAQ